MEDINFWHLYGEAAKTAVGFFWKAGWAFVLGYSVSAVIQAFVPKGRLTPYIGSADIKSVSLATAFGAASSSCSFAALAAARSLVMKGAHFIAAVAFMFASTNLVIELGILIFIFLGWQFLVAEIVGGLLLISISSILIKVTYPEQWFKEARERVEEEAEEEEGDFNWRDRIRTREGWYLVGNRYVSDWKMVWEEILIGFTVAGFMAVFVPSSFWEKIFLIGSSARMPDWLITLENAVVAPFVAAATFIGSMGNIPLATILSANNVYFAGIMGFIYSDLMVPPLVMINARYYGKSVALYVAGIMLVSIVSTAMVLHYAFELLGITPERERRVQEVSQFSLDYTFYMNFVFIFVAIGMVFLHRKHLQSQDAGGGHEMEDGVGPKRVAALLALVILIGGLVAYFITGGTAP